MAKRTKKLSRKNLVLGAGVLLVLLLAGLGWAHWHNKSTKPSTTSPSGSLSPPTAADKQAASDNKDQIVNNQTNQDNSSNTAIKNVTVVITDANSSGVRGYVQSVFEEGGTCTATATQGSQTVTKTSTGFENVSYTQCAPINWSSTLGVGNWTIALAYKSSDAAGSVSRTIEVK